MEIESPKSLSFDDVNHYIHMTDAPYEDLQSLCLTLAIKLESEKKFSGRLARKVNNKSHSLTQCQEELRKIGWMQRAICRAMFWLDSRAKSLEES